MFFWNSLSFSMMPLFVIGMKTDLFPSWGHCWVFQICWLIEYRTLALSSFRSWNSSAGVPSALLVVMPSKADLTLDAGMSVTRWVITPSWLSRSLRSFLYTYSMYPSQFLLISSTSFRSIPFLSFIVPIFAWNIPSTSNFHKEISSVYRPIDFLPI